MLFYFSNKNRIDIASSKDIFIRKGSYFYEIDGKFRKIDDGFHFAETIDSPFEVCILTYSRQIQSRLAEEVRMPIRNGINLMKEEKYWLAHETFEELWKYYEGDVSRFFHGTVLLCVSMVHYQMGHQSTAIRIFENAKRELEPFLGISLGEWHSSYPLEDAKIQEIEDYSHFMLHFQ